MNSLSEGERLSVLEKKNEALTSLIDQNMSTTMEVKETKVTIMRNKSNNFMIRKGFMPC